MRHCLGAVGDTISDSCVLFLIQQEVLHTVPKPTVHSRILKGILAHFGAEICSNPLFPITVTLSAGAAKSSVAKVSKGSRRRHRGAVCRDQRSGRSERASGAAAGKGRVRCATRACECALPCSGRESPVERARAEHVHIICRGRRRARTAGSIAVDGRITSGSLHSSDSRSLSSLRLLVIARRSAPTTQQ